MKLVILDRDGVINHDSDQFVKTLEEWIPISGSIQAIADLSKAGFTVAVASNQSGIARGLITPDNIKAMHDRLNSLVSAAGGELAALVFCPHGPDDQCACRKPKPGLIDQLFQQLGKPEQCWIIGDSLRDLAAGMARGCKPILVRTGKGNKTLQGGLSSLPKGTRIFDDLAQASQWLISEAALQAL